MIRLHRAALPADTVSRMDAYTVAIARATERVVKARELWGHTTVRRNIRPDLIAALRGMAPGYELCMYCGNNEAMDIDHFEPLSLAPQRTFDWQNHLYACSMCNSHHKRNSFPYDENGRPLLIDPTVQEPLEHLHLVLGAGEYTHRTPQGEASIKVFGLNRRSLVQGRLLAYSTARDSLTLWRIHTDKGQYENARVTVRTAWNRPLADVLASMFHQSVLPVAAALFDGEDDVLGLLRDPELRARFLDQE
ncbi:HNH endonuclease [Streptomyces capitiformicae]|uniref:HNH endonuclease n=2 Tax=Streptomyces capitiformicae TaxID=2014920 RepID=A0A919DL14_9ACTN|nr:HNH endonuclease [Streptomyces capitiformicae]